MNPILNQLMKQSNGMTNLMQMFNVVKSAGNPQAMLMQMMKTNPQYAQVMNLVNERGGDPKSAFYSLAKEKGVDPNEILKMLK